MQTLEIAGLKITKTTKKELLFAILQRIKTNQKTWVITPYSEFLYFALKDSEILELLNKADLSVPDGIGIFWAQKYLSIPFTFNNYWFKILQSFWQVIYTSIWLIFRKFDIKIDQEQFLKEKIPGSDLIWELANLAALNNFSLYLLGGFGETPKITAEKLQNKFGNNLKIVGYSSKNPEDDSIINDINNAHPDMLFVAYGPIKQEKWIHNNLNKLSTKFVIGLGGSFDYISGNKQSPPNWIRKIGFEWLFRLITQPYRIKRIWQATYGLILKLIKYKIFMSFPYRKNVLSVILNNQNQILICQRNAKNPDDKKFGFKEENMLNYWQFPQGGAGLNETPEQTAMRECKEELNLQKLEVIYESPNKYSYFYQNANRPLFKKQGLYKGQNQTLVYLKKLDANEPVFVDNVEFISFNWVAINSLLESVHLHRRPVAEIIVEDLNYLKKKAII